MIPRLVDYNFETSQKINSGIYTMNISLSIIANFSLLIIITLAIWSLYQRYYDKEKNVHIYNEQLNRLHKYL